MSYEKTENPKYVKDKTNNALLSVDQNELEMYRNKVKQIKESKNAINKIETMEDQVNNLQNDVTEIKDLLIRLLER
tara:strand:+ start:984 stop:1211 length:228 start_codon:yes stop_codon:yes gene_type:complete